MLSKVPKPLPPSEDKEMEGDEDLENFMEVEVGGIFIKHDFDHVILEESEVEKYSL